MKWEYIYAAAFVSWAFGMLFGGWLTNRRWAGNAEQPFRVSYRGRLYKVEDVTPWGKP